MRRSVRRQTSDVATHGSFLGRLSNGVIYIEWTSTTSGLAGTLYANLVRQSGGGHETLETESSALSWGTLVGSRISLSLASGANISGTLSGPNLILGYPVDQSGQIGTVIELPMHQASTGEYHQALAALRKTVKAANEAVAVSGGA